LDDTDEESTIWDAVDEVLICGKGEMIKTLPMPVIITEFRKKTFILSFLKNLMMIFILLKKNFLIENVEMEFKMLGKI
jgi:ring-1,2-phenylacetyl-CoA epoxidase subunit PaaE